MKRSNLGCLDEGMDTADEEDEEEAEDMDENGGEEKVSEDDEASVVRSLYFKAMRVIGDPLYVASQYTSSRFRSLHRMHLP